jgi:hypothetical protein
MALLILYGLRDPAVSCSPMILYTSHVYTKLVICKFIWVWCWVQRDKEVVQYFLMHMTHA